MGHNLQIKWIGCASLFYMLRDGEDVNTLKGNATEHRKKKPIKIMTNKKHQYLYSIANLDQTRMHRQMRNLPTITSLPSTSPASTSSRATLSDVSARDKNQVIGIGCRVAAVTFKQYNITLE